MIINIIEARGGVGFVTTSILGWVYWMDRRDYVGHSEYRERWVCLNGKRGGGLNATFKKSIGRRIMRFQTNIWVCKFEEMGWDYVSKKKIGKLLCSAYTGMLLRKNRNCIWLQKQ